MCIDEFKTSLLTSNSYFCALRFYILFYHRQPNFVASWALSLSAEGFIAISVLASWIYVYNKEAKDSLGPFASFDSYNPQVLSKNYCLFKKIFRALLIPRLIKGNHASNFIVNYNLRMVIFNTTCKQKNSFLQVSIWCKWIHIKVSQLNTINK